MINKRQEFMYYIDRMLFLPYYYGGDDPLIGFDCSGSINEGFKSIGFMKNSDDKTAQGLRDWLQPKKVAMPVWGCLVFFKRPDGSIFHVGVVKNELQMYEFGGGTSETTSLAAAIKQNAYGRIRPFATRTDIDCYVDPFI